MTLHAAGGTVVFGGPSLEGIDVDATLPGAIVLPPARCGDVVGCLRLRPSVIVLLDGLYDTTPAPWHKELLWALEAGVAVVGAASMGALRAAELQPFGLVGVGAIYDAYRSGTETADDAVAVLQHTISGRDVAATQATVEIEAALNRLLALGILGKSEATTAAAEARRRHFTERSLAGALEAALGAERARSILSDPTAESAVGHSQKRADALAALERVAAAAPQAPVLPEPLSRTVHIVRLAARAALQPLRRADPALPAAERRLAEDFELARRAGWVGGLVRTVDLVVGHGGGIPEARSRPRPARGVTAAVRTGIDDATRLVESHYGDHPAAATSAARLRRLGSALATTGAGPVAPVLRAALGPLVGETPGGEALVEFMGALLRLLEARTEIDLAHPPFEPSTDALAHVLEQCGPLAPTRDALVHGAELGRRRLMACLFDIALAGGEVTYRVGPAVHPFDAPLIDGLALLDAAVAMTSRRSARARASGAPPAGETYPRAPSARRMCPTQPPGRHREHRSGRHGGWC